MNTRLYFYTVPDRLKYLSEYSSDTIYNRSTILNKYSSIPSTSTYTKELILKCKEPHTLLERNICHDYNLKKKMQGKNISTV